MYQHWGIHIGVFILGYSYWGIHIGVFILGYSHWGIHIGVFTFGYSHWGIHIGVFTFYLEKYVFQSLLMLYISAIDLVNSEYTHAKKQGLK